MEDKNNHNIRLKIVPIYALYKQIPVFFLMLLCIGIYPLVPFLVKYDFRFLIIGIVSILFFKIIYGYLWYHLMRIDLYEDRMTFKEGVFSVKTNFLELYRVKDYKVHQSFLMRLFKIQNIILITSDKSRKVIEIKGIEKSNVINIIRIQVEQQRKKKGVREFD